MGFGKDGRGAIVPDQIDTGFGALAANDAVLLGGNYDGTIIEDFRMIKLEYWMGVRPAQAVVIEDGPVLVGLAAGNLTAANIEESLETIPLDGASINNELAMRAVWPLEVFTLPDADSGDNATLWRKGEKVIRWTFHNPHGWTWWVYNMSGVVLITGSSVQIQAKIFGVWVP